MNNGTVYIKLILRHNNLIKDEEFIAFKKYLFLLLGKQSHLVATNWRFFKRSHSKHPKLLHRLHSIGHGEQFKLPESKKAS